MGPANDFTNDFPFSVQILLRYHYAVIQFLIIWSHEVFARHNSIAAMTWAEFSSNPFNIIWVKNKLKWWLNLYCDRDIVDEYTKIDRVSGGLPILDTWSHECWSLVTHMCGWTGSSFVPVIFLPVWSQVITWTNVYLMLLESLAGMNIHIEVFIHPFFENLIIPLVFLKWIFGQHEKIMH